jgi:hypothetical protein
MSGPMTNQSSLDSTAKEAGADSAFPYGTRSRNRTGTSRINYAEDRDIDGDVYDYYHDKKDSDSKKTSRQSSAAVNGDGPRGGASSRKAGTDEQKAAQVANAPKEQRSGSSNNVPTTTQQSAASQPARKRKVAGNPAGSTNSAASVNNSTKKAATSGATPSIVWPESNMLTFDNCKSRPVNGKMVADDGTSLEPNGNMLPSEWSTRNSDQTWLTW